MPALRWTSVALTGIFAVALSVPGTAQSVDPRAEPAKPAPKVKLDKYRLTAEEIAARTDVVTAYDAVKLLRPNFLKETRLSGKIGGGYRIGESVGPGPPPSRDGTPREGTGGSGGSSGGSGGSSGGIGAGADPTRAGAGARGESGMGAFENNPSGKVTAVLYVDEMKQYGLDELKNIRATEVTEIRLLTPAEAGARYGTGHEGGAIMLKTNRTRQ